MYVYKPMKKMREVGIRSCGETGTRYGQLASSRTPRDHTFWIESLAPVAQSDSSPIGDQEVTGSISAGSCNSLS